MFRGKESIEEEANMATIGQTCEFYKLKLLDLSLFKANPWILWIRKKVSKHFPYFSQATGLRFYCFCPGLSVLSWILHPQ